jgi:hypothetical protein
MIHPNLADAKSAVRQRAIPVRYSSRVREAKSSRFARRTLRGCCWVGNLRLMDDVSSLTIAADYSSEHQNDQGIPRADQSCA